MMVEEMGHCISALVIRGNVSSESATNFDAKIVESLDGFTLIALEDEYVDTWSDRLGILGTYAEIPLLNYRVVHHIANELGCGQPFAIIETEYHGGHGSQSAAVYHGDVELMTPANNQANVINDGLRLLGVTHTGLLDEFDTLGLGNYRSWGELFSDYQDG
jgi:hypothetical protein